MDENIKVLLEYEKKLSLINQIGSLLSWDQYTLLPEKAVKQRADQLEYLEQLSYAISHNPKYISFISQAQPKLRNLPAMERTIFQYRFKEIERGKNISLDLTERYVKASCNGYLAWMKAVKNNNFSIFKPHLESLVSISQEFAKQRGEDAYISAILDYEDDAALKELDAVFAELKAGLIEIISKVKESKTYTNQQNCPNGQFNIAEQGKLATALCKYIGMDGTRTVCANTVHPFQSSISQDDKRIAIAYREDNLMFCLGSVIHEFGHLSYEMGIDEKYANTYLDEVNVMSLHESQSRLWENHIGMSSVFWEGFFSTVQKHFTSLKDMSYEEWYRTINKINGSMIRLESDELHYALHIIIRYEIERDLLNGKLSVDNLQETWNRKYHEAFGAVPKDDIEGVLQDVHWSEGMFGYFPSYTIGDIYSSMFYEKMSIDNPKINNEISNGKFNTIHSWLTENIHKHSTSLPTKTLLQNVCGKKIDIQCHLTYLKNKYYSLYES